MLKRFLSVASPVVMVALLAGCYVDPPYAPEFPAGNVQGYQPVYISFENSAISFQEPRALKNPGKIYIVGRYLLINEKAAGIHVFDNSDAEHPNALGFLYVPGNTDMAVTNNVLYVNHLSDLVALNISDWQDIREISRIPQPHWAPIVPPGSQRYFECVDPSKGYVVGWNLVSLNNPKCFH